MRMRIRVLMFTCCTLAAVGGCVAAAAGAGAAGAIYVIDRGAETSLLATPPVVEASAKRVFGEMGIKETKTGLQQEAGGEKRVVEGTMDDREISVNIETAGTGSKVVVIARKSMVTWDKELARQILERIVAGAK
jgi:uncharacterized protein YneF (UPF0154 family)